MDFQLEKPEAVIKAQEKQKGMHCCLEVLVFIVVFWVCLIVQSLCVAPAQTYLISKSADYQAALMSGDIGKMADAAIAVSYSDTVILISFFATITMTVVTLLFCRLVQKRGPETLGFTRQGIVREYLRGLGLGLVMFSAVVLVCILTGAIRIEGISANFHPGLFVLFVFAFMIQGMGEEALCRGYFMVSVGRRYPMWTAVFLNAVVFAALHLLNAGISGLAFVNLALFGVFASFYFVKRGNIWGIGAIHSVWNLLQGNFWGLRVSGVALECSVIQTSLTGGRDFIHGGTFGPEGGLAVTVVLMAGICLLLQNRKDRLGRPR